MRSMHKIALIGRPNVGKSTLFNRLIHSNRAITHDRPGITRDRIEGVVKRRERPAFTIIDTGGLSLTAEAEMTQGPEGLRGFEEDILKQAEIALKESAALVLVVDGRQGLLPLDEYLAKFLRQTGKPVLMAVNKIDGMEKEDERLADFYAPGLPLIAVSAEHGHNLRAFEDCLFDLLPPEAEEKAEGAENSEEEEKSLRLAVIGRPNTGKSSLVNALAGEERMIVSPIAGATRDSVDVTVRRGRSSFVFIDTAGIRRKAKVTDTVEKFSVNSSIKSSTKADVTLLVFDASEGISVQDKKLMDLLHEHKTPFMVLVNKVDLVPAAKLKALKADFADILKFCSHIPIIYISALKAMGLNKILPMAGQIHAECMKRVPTSQLNRAMDEVLARHQPPIVKRSRAKFYYLTQAEANPPTFVFFVNDAEKVLESYQRYLEKSLRQIFSIVHAPMRLKLRSSHKSASERRQSKN